MNRPMFNFGCQKNTGLAFMWACCHLKKTSAEEAAALDDQRFRYAYDPSISEDLRDKWYDLLVADGVSEEEASEQVEKFTPEFAQQFVDDTFSGTGFQANNAVDVTTMHVLSNMFIAQQLNGTPTEGDIAIRDAIKAQFYKNDTFLNESDREKQDFTEGTMLESVMILSAHANLKQNDKNLDNIIKQADWNLRKFGMHHSTVLIDETGLTPAPWVAIIMEGYIDKIVDNTEAGLDLEAMMAEIFTGIAERDLFVSTKIDTTNQGINLFVNTVFTPEQLTQLFIENTQKLQSSVGKHHSKVKNSELEGVSYYWGERERELNRKNWTISYSYKGSAIFLHFKDGWALKNPTVPPSDIDVEASRRDHPERWVKGREARVGGPVLKPQKRGYRVDLYVQRPNVSTTNRGRNVRTTWKHLKLTKDGRFETGVVSLSSHNYDMAALTDLSTHVVTTKDKSGTFSSVNSAVSGGGMITNNRNPSGAGGQSGYYLIDGNTIELRYDNGTFTRALFGTDGSENAIMGNTNYWMP